MKIHQETTLATIAGASDNERLLVVLCHQPGQGSTLQLRQQSWGEGVGWFTQNSLPLEPQQVAELRGALGTGNADAARALPRSFSRLAEPGNRPRVVRVDSA